MSTKIHNGLILPNATLEQALAKLRAVRVKCVAAGVKAIATLIAEQMALSADLAANYCPLGKSGKERPYMKAQREFFAAREEVEGKGVRNVTWDFTFSVLVIPHGQDILAMFFVEEDLGYRQALTYAGFEDFHYQNSTDRPEGISEEAWEARRNTWDEVLPGRTAPCEVGFSYEVVTWHDLGTGFYCMDRIKACLPDDADRADMVAMFLAECEADHTPGFRDLRLVEMFIHLKREAAGRCDGVTLSTTVFEV